MPDDQEQITFAHAGNQYSVTVPKGLSDIEAYQWATANKPKFAALNLPSPGAAQAHAQMKAAIPTMAASEAADFPGAQKGLSPFTTAGQRQASLGEGYSDYMRQSGIFAGIQAGTMGAGTIAQGVKGVAGLAARALATGAGAGGGALATGASPEEAAKTAAAGAVAQPIAEAIGAGTSAVAKKVFGAKPPIPITEEWQKINDAIGVKASQIRIGEGATDLSQAATMPGRALAKVGLTSEALEKMTPLEQQQAIIPIRQKAAADLNHAFQQATDNGTQFDVGKSATEVLKRIKGLGQQKAIDAFNSLVEEADIANQRTATPLEARDLRQMLGYGARFGQGGDLSSLASVRAELYRAVNRDLHEAVPGLQDLDQFFSDVKTAGQAVRNSVAKAASKAPELEPSTAEKAAGLAKGAAKIAVRGALGYGAYHTLRELIGGGAP